MKEDIIELVQTCYACPEQYDAYLGGENIGYLRLRHGYFYAEYKNKRVYESETIGDGIFDSDEREIQLTKAKLSILKEYLQENYSSL